MITYIIRIVWAIIWIMIILILLAIVQIFNLLFNFKVCKFEFKIENKDGKYGFLTFYETGNWKSLLHWAFKIKS